MSNYIVYDMERYKIMKLIDEIHEIMDYIDDGYHNSELACLTKISNELVAKLDNSKKGSV